MCPREETAREGFRWWERSANEQKRKISLNTIICIFIYIYISYNVYAVCFFSQMLGAFKVISPLPQARPVGEPCTFVLLFAVPATLHRYYTSLQIPGIYTYQVPVRVCSMNLSTGLTKCRTTPCTVHTIQPVIVDTIRLSTVRDMCSESRC